MISLLLIAELDPDFIQILNTCSHDQIQLHAGKQSHTLFRVSVLQEVTPSEGHGRCVVGAKVVDELVPVVLLERLLHSLGEILGELHLIAVEGHLDCVDRALGIRLIGSLLVSLGRVREFLECPGKAKGSFEERHGKPCVEFSDPF